MLYFIKSEPFQKIQEIVVFICKFKKHVLNMLRHLANEYFNGEFKFLFVSK